MLPQYDVHLGHIGEGRPHRIYIFRHSGLSLDEQRHIEQVPSGRTLFIGGERTKRNFC